MGSRSDLKSEKVLENTDKAVNVVDLLKKVKFQEQKERKNIVITMGAAVIGLIVIGVIASI